MQQKVVSGLASARAPPPHEELLGLSQRSTKIALIVSQMAVDGS
jgi:hypothetical protein